MNLHVWLKGLHFLAMNRNMIHLGQMMTTNLISGKTYEVIIRCDVFWGLVWSQKDISFIHFEFSVLDQQIHIKHSPIINRPIVAQSMIDVYLVP